ncbi:MAG: hypothetical protein JWM11_2320 [Planctomycetaceae bacterium]|nr:hypothetical protein [Planctomycetaceae bacterium]
MLFYIPIYQEHQRLIADYPLEDLTPRLAYERSNSFRPTLSNNSLALNAISPLQSSGLDANQLESLDQKFFHAAYRNGDNRLVWTRERALRSLSKIHTGFVADFIEQPGFGRSRMPTRLVRERDVTLSVPERIPQPPPAPAQPGSADEPPDKSVQSAHAVDQNKHAKQSSDDRVSDSPAEFHLEQIVDFVPVESLGVFDQDNKVRGFQSHAFREMPGDLKPQTDQFRWKLEQLELVSMLKHEVPVAYVSKNLPAMDELKEAPTRPLDAFEEQAITTLLKGEEIVINTGYNQQRMVGSIRAVSKCMKCHAVVGGALLGAFTYRFYRDPLLPVPVRPKKTL